MAALLGRPRAVPAVFSAAADRLSHAEDLLYNSVHVFRAASATPDAIEHALPLRFEVSTVGITVVYGHLRNH